MALSIAYWATYVDGHRKLTRKSEAAVESDRVLKFVFDKEYQVINLSVQASMNHILQSSSECTSHVPTPIMYMYTDELLLVYRHVLLF